EFAEGENTEDSQSVYEDVGITLPDLDETQIAQSENEFRDVSLYLKTSNGRVQGAEHPPFELPNRWTYATLKAIVEDYVERMTGAPIVVDQLYYKKARGKSVVLLNNDGDLTALLKEYPLLHKCGKKKMKSTMYLAVDYHNQSNKEEEHHTPVTPRRSPRIANSCFDIFVYEMAKDMKVCTTANVLHKVSRDASLKEITTLLQTYLDEAIVYTPAKGLYWLRKGAKQPVSLRTEQDLQSCKNEYKGQNIRLACHAIQLQKSP
ncbi:hypothetical protein QZH41_018860, partial [Actinostola sp. cb2023]